MRCGTGGDGFPHRQLDDRECRDGLRLPVFEDIEIVLGQPADELAIAIRYHRIDFDVIDREAEGRSLGWRRLLRARDRRACEKDRCVKELTVRPCLSSSNLESDFPDGWRDLGSVDRASTLRV